MNYKHGVLIDPKNPYETARTFRIETQFVNSLSTLYYEASTWWRWDGTKYREIDPAILSKEVYDWLATCVHYAKVQDKFEKVSYSPLRKFKDDIIDVLKGLCLIDSVDMPVFIGGDQNNASDIIPFRNGLLNIESYLNGAVDLQPHTPLWFSSSCLPFDFVQEAECPKWNWFINDIMMGNQEAVRCLQKWIGLLLTNDTRHQKMMVFTGTGRNGKGALNRVIYQLLGQDNYCTPTMSDCQNRFQRAKWFGKLAAIIPDAHMGRDSDAIEVLQWIKMVVGEDRVDLDRKNREPLTGVKLPTRIILACNEVPRLPDASKAIGARMIFIPFHQSYLGREDLAMEDRLSEELPGILLWALEGLKMIREEGISQPDVGSGYAADFNDASSPMHAFVSECCEIGEELSYPKDEFRRILNIWLDGNGYKMYSDALVTAKLKAVNSRLESAKQRLKDGLRQPIFKGISIKKEYVNSFNLAQIGGYRVSKSA